MGGKGSGRRRAIDLPYLDWIRTLPCAVAGRGYRIRESWADKVRTHRCRGGVQAHHVISRGAMGPDRKCIPLCDGAHRQWHTWGRSTFQRRYALDALKLTEELNGRYPATEYAF